MDFELHPNLAKKQFVIDLSLCRVLLENEKHYPWLLFVPRRANVSRLIELSLEDQQQLWAEVDLAQHILWNQFHPTQLNLAAIGNKTPQLHVHVIARFSSDPAWPGTVWDHPVRKLYSAEELEATRSQLKGLFQAVDLNNIL